ncbi:MAG TPA: hypothetical protein VNZ26_34545, partial [Vicinamibacterales bacterium]|nr:hypothetical protein [Vicinamibacterales bacterium]
YEDGRFGAPSTRGGGTTEGGGTTADGATPAGRLSPVTADPADDPVCARAVPTDGQASITPHTSADLTENLTTSDSFG